MFALTRDVLSAAGIAGMDLAGVYSIDQRQNEPAIIQVATKFGLRFECFSAEDLEEQTPHLLNPSERVFELVGCHGVAESAALAALRPDGVLVVGKTKSAHATAALAVKR
ncbi:precorrin methylase [Phyllobacterium brassicacearum]|uniref:Precorrin methylase n=2 Tax=Phyllobacterium brassicacearum TaxID=314235 RepID=A0A2P7BU67_9HYPH|nr:precorrin methylase [Phyllobacterium brassicacearum]